MNKPHVDGQRRFYPDNPTKQAWYAKRRQERYARYIRSLSNKVGCR